MISTTQEAIDEIRCDMCIRHEEMTDDLYEALDMAMDALKKQIPVKPVKSKDPRYGMGYVYHDWVCPSCGKFLAYEPEESGCHHCKCGQAIDWEV